MNAWALPAEVFGFLKRRLPAGSTVVELGSGEGTAHLAVLAGCLYSVEHDQAYIGKVEGTRYIYAPIVDGWYAEGPLEAELPRPDAIDCVIVDGPPGDIGRIGLLAHLPLFGRGPMLIDDVHRPREMALALALAETRQTHLVVYRLGGGRAFATVGWEDFA